MVGGEIKINYYYYYYYINCLHLKGVDFRPTSFLYLVMALSLKKKG
jgi:hypothetical protein